MTDSLNVTVTAIDWPALYEPSVVDEDTDETVGAVLSTVKVPVPLPELLYVSLPVTVAVASPSPAPTV